MRGQITSNDGIKELCYAIIEQAVTDYKDLCAQGITIMRYSKDEKISKNEITKFLKSTWCDALLDEIGCHYDGEQIVEILQRHVKGNIHNNEKMIAAYKTSGELVATFKTFSECAQFAGLKTDGDICRCCNGHRKTAGGYVWKYIEKQ